MLLSLFFHIHTIIYENVVWSVAENIVVVYFTPIGWFLQLF